MFAQEDPRNLRLVVVITLSEVGEEIKMLTEHALEHEVVRCTGDRAVEVDVVLPRVVLPGEPHDIMRLRDGSTLTRKRDDSLLEQQTRLENVSDRGDLESRDLGASTREPVRNLSEVAARAATALDQAPVFQDPECLAEDVSADSHLGCKLPLGRERLTRLEIDRGDVIQELLNDGFVQTLRARRLDHPISDLCRLARTSQAVSFASLRLRQGARP